MLHQYCLAYRALNNTASVRMIIAIALVCFAVGFLAAIVVASNPTRSRKDVVGLSDWLRVVRSDVSSMINSNCWQQQLSTRVVPVANEEDAGLLSKYVPGYLCHPVWSTNIVIENKSKHRTVKTAGKDSPIRTSRLPLWQEKVA